MPKKNRSISLPDPAMQAPEKSIALEVARLPIKLRSADDIAALVAARRPTVDSDSVLLAVYLRDAEWSAQMQAFIGIAGKPSRMPRKSAPSQEKK